MNKFLRLFTALVLTIIPIVSVAQVRSVSGRVTDSSGGAVAGAVVMVEGTGTYTTTDAAGNYSIKLPSGAKTLLVQMMGMEDARISLDGAQTTYDVSLQDSLNYLEEAVAIGYGSIIRKELSSSVSSVHSEQLIERASAFNVTQALAGKVAGYTVYNTSGRPGGSNTVRIRGLGSVNAGSSPLYVVDGVVDVSIDMINPNDIESIDVLKDAAATAVYGAKGANGVIIVTTKTGRTGDGRVTYTGSVGVSSLARTYKEMTGEEYLKALRDAYAYSGSVFDPYFTTPYEKLFDYEKNPDGSYATDAAGLLIPKPRYNTKWMQEYYQNGLTIDQNISFSKAGERSSVYASVGYKSMDGIIRNTDAKRLNASINFTSHLGKVADLRIGANFSSSRQNRNDILIDGSIYHVVFDNIAPFIPYKYEDGSYGQQDDHLTMSSNYDYNTMLDEAMHRRRTTQTVLNAAIDFHLLPGLDLTVKGDMQSHFSSFEQSAPGGISGATISNNGFSNIANSDVHRWSNEDYLTYRKSFFSDRLKTTSVLGTSFYYMHGESSSGGGTNYPEGYGGYMYMQDSQTWDSSSSGYDKQTMHSVYFRTNLAMDGRYLLGVTLRADGASNFGDNNKYGFFPSASAGWIVSEEPWFPVSKDVVSLFKLRASFGQVGNAAIPSYRTFDRLSLSGEMIFDKTVESTATLSEPGNRDLQWETSTQYDFGFDLSLWNDRVNLVADFYNRDTRKLLYQVQVPSSTGYSSTWSNIGLLRNRGYEITLRTHPVDTRDFKWDVDFIYSQNITKAVDINGDKIYNSLTPVLSVEGEEWQQLWVYKCLGVWQLDEVEEADVYGFKPGDIKLADLNKDGQLSDDDRYLLGRVTPKHEFTLVNTFYWKGFNLMVDMMAKTGYWLYCGRWSNQYLTTDNIHVSANYAWTPNNQGTIFPANRSGSDKWGWNGRYYDAECYKGDYLKVRNVSLSYDLKYSLLKNVRSVSGIALGVLAEDIYTLTGVPALATEDSGWGDAMGVVGGTYPRPMTISGTLKITF
ncbi:MAG: SusC/RagA family TonB-linked outer membrane protein [Bacteroidales bacterium]|nr:SusC/RagA family TonB-linked outer membrane protein [Bacteroidales bacterium]